VKKIVKLAALALAIPVLLGALIASSKSEAETNRAVITAATEQLAVQAGSSKTDLISANNAFGIDLLKENIKLAKNTDGSKNIIIGPTSVSLALSMTANGADGQTKDDMLSSLKYGQFSLNQINDGNKALIASLVSSDPAVVLQSANALWANKEITFLTPFLDTCSTIYGAKVSVLDFSLPETVVIINKWIADQTKGKIDSIIDKLAADEILLLTNATYFKGTWSIPFDKQSTQPTNFMSSSGKTTSVPMMNRSGNFNYLKGTGFQAVELPYGEKHISMFVFLPDQGASKPNDTFLAQFTAQNWQTWINGFKSKPGSLSLPKFKATYETNLRDALSALGMACAFDPSCANFKKMCDVKLPVYIGKVIHKTILEVDEKGTEAAATTSVHMMLGAAAPSPDRFNMVVDHPFVVVIRDNQSGSILFLATIEDFPS
jgi:serpin B